MTEQNDNIEFIGREDGTVKTPRGLALPDQSLPKRLYILPVNGRPFFPAQVQPVVVNQNPWEETLNRVAATDHSVVGLSYVEHPPKDSHAGPEDLALHGCAVRIHHAAKENGKIQFIAQGIRRFRVVHWLKRTPPYLVEVEYPEEPREHQDEQKAYTLAIINSIKELLRANPLYGEEVKNYLSRFGPEDSSPLTDFGASMTSAKGPELQEILDTVPLLKRMEKTLLLLRKELEVAQLQAQINEEVNDKVQKHQREFFLREQLKIIQRELGIAKDDKTADADSFRERMAKLSPPEHVLGRFDDELQKLSVLEQGSPEYGVTRNYLDWLTNVPWGQYSNDHLDLKLARKTLDQDHDGLGDIKERIIEFLAEGAYKGEMSGSILLLVGPPGVGKTSIGHSIASALGRKFYRFSVGGMRDEAEIKGHRRTYIGAMPGKFVQALKDVQVSNPVIMLDEIDKIGSSYQGDPASALLEALDPEQNSEFLDHYLDTRLDLSKVLFVCTANQLDTIPRPLLDRMDTIRLSGYITDEKLAIAKHHLFPKLLKRAGLRKKQMNITDAALRQVIEGYAREAGVRNLEKMLHKILRKGVVKLLEGEESSIRIGIKDLQDYLGQPLFRRDRALRGIGVVTGLAWTSMGGATLGVEAARIHSQNRGFKLTGQLGDVMKESAEIAYSYVSSHLKDFRGDAAFFDKSFVHLHVPEGATPKDGPSAGVTMATALVSLARREAPHIPVAMTGELTLTGQVLPVGGIREKVIAARRQKIATLILPEANRGDFEELPEYLREGLTVHFAQHYSDVYRACFEDKAKRRTVVH
ncbi:endopeptidase La [Hydrocarboniclastica marina]|uniref:Lon protease n=1 Tax=Hydrocarboniclastica marina TaxID=2259620 RepID=A0A4P7XIH9_9ALTE|nr:endopeptidase La [Hydrocarboniclastica marina]MAM00072.1 endopeptidase La [Alteromonadaceae bacterium]QCF26891.1 endopeptidase La [Hydrocarboniclastica marina]|tara:strand:+ start:1465 stop:3894 length:2430 start_codon:yes stop_codon:yes gene_type:complete